MSEREREKAFMWVLDTPSDLIAYGLNNGIVQWYCSTVNH